MIQAVITPEHRGKPIEVLLNASKVLQGCKKEKEVKIDLLPTLAPLIDERCNYNAMIEYVTIRKLKRIKCIVYLVFTITNQII